jgi:hypothetical protein
VATGLFANDDIAFEGPLYALVGKELSDRVVGIHRLIEPLIMLLVFAHLAAIAFYTRVKKDRTLVMPMVTGWKAVSANRRKGGGAIAFCIALAIALMAAYGASGAWLPAGRVSTTPLPAGTALRRSSRSSTSKKRPPDGWPFFRQEVTVFSLPCGTCRDRPCRLRRACRTGP